MYVQRRTNEIVCHANLGALFCAGHEDMAPAPPPLDNDSHPDPFQNLPAANPFFLRVLILLLSLQIHMY